MITHDNEKELELMSKFDAADLILTELKKLQEEK